MSPDQERTYTVACRLERGRSEYGLSSSRGEGKGAEEGGRGREGRRGEDSHGHRVE